MKWILLFTTALVSFSAGANSDIEGVWKYVAYSYEGNVYPAPDPDLDLRFAFLPNRVSILKWLYLGQKGFCESHAEYEVREGNWLYQKTKWVRPSNQASCAQHPEMRVGFESLTHFKVENDRLMLELELEGRPFIYILNLIEPKEL